MTAVAPAIATGLSVGFAIDGKAIQQGSKRIGRDAQNKPIIIDDNDEELSVWRDTVTVYTRRAMAKAKLREPLSGALGARIIFCLRPPQRMPKGRVWPEVKPDIDKLIRAIFDSLKTGGAVIDDAQIVAVTSLKTYPNVEPYPMAKPGVQVLLWQIVGVA
jgi:Holliday junction resolvase RusA-like endonuclease